MKISKQMNTSEEVVVTMSRSEFIALSSRLSAKVAHEYAKEFDTDNVNPFKNPIVLLAIDTLSRFMKHFDDTVFSIEEDTAEESKNE